MTAPVLDVTRPESAQGVGVELADSTSTLAASLAETPSLERAVVDRQAIAAAVERVTEFFGPFKAMAFKLHRALCDRENAILAPLRQLDTDKRDAIREFKRKEDEARRDAERAEAERRFREQQARVEEEALALERAGHMGTAAAVRSEAATAPLPVVVLPDKTKTVVQFRRRYLWRYAGGDIAKASALVPREYLTVDERAISAYARAMMGRGAIPGIEFYTVDDPIR